MLFRSPFGRVLGTVFGAFGMILVGFWGFETEMNFEAEVGSRKSGSRDAKGGLAGRWPEDLAALKTIVDQSIIGIIDHWSLESLIVGHWHRWTRFARWTTTPTSCFVPRARWWILYIYIYIYLFIYLLIYLFIYIHPCTYIYAYTDTSTYMHSV